MFMTTNSVNQCNFIAGWLNAKRPAPMAHSYRLGLVTWGYQILIPVRKKTVNLAIFACLNVREFFIWGLFTRFRIREFSCFFYSILIIILFLRDSWIREFVLLGNFAKIKTSVFVIVVVHIQWCKLFKCMEFTVLPMVLCTIKNLWINLK